MGLKSLKICILTILFLLPGTASAVIATSASYTLEVAAPAGTGFDATSASYGTTGITDENFNASSTTYNLCGGLPSEVWGCGITPPAPPPGGGGGGIAGGRPPEAEEEIIIEPEPEIPEYVIFPWDKLRPAEEPQPPEEPEVAPAPGRVVVKGAAPEVIPSPPQPSYVAGDWCTDAGCFGAAKVIFRPAAPELTYIGIYPVTLYALALLLIILAALLILLSYWTRKKA